MQMLRNVIKLQANMTSFVTLQVLSNDVLLIEKISKNFVLKTTN